MDKDRADRKGTDKDRAKLIRNDNELGDEDEDDEPWQRKLMHTRWAHLCTALAIRPCESSSSHLQ